MPKIYLLDTNVVSEMTKSIQNQNVISRIFQTQKQSVLCSVTWGEALYGASRMPDGKRKDFIMDFYINSVQKSYSFVDFDIHAATIYSDLKTRLEKIGKPAQELDLQIAACAIANNLILVTRNKKDFLNIQEVSNLMIENWFE
ncbi:MAG: PIN domain-containing protein [Treponema sp.]|nr:PIN domain-containing protein [Treponema sp.]